MRRLAVALEMRQHAQTRRYALGYLFGRHPLAAWEEELLLMPRLVLAHGPTEVSGVRGETECPSAHWDQVGKPCYVCGGAI